MAFSTPVVDFLKIRGSWGTIGDQTVPNTLYLPLMSSGFTSWIGANGQRRFLWVHRGHSTYITWQDIESKNVGIDLGLFQNKLTLHLMFIKEILII